MNRRNFIYQTFGGIAWLTLMANCRPRSGAVVPSAKKQKLGVALVGLGYYSTDLLAPALQETEHCYLAGIVTGTPEKAERWKQQYNLKDQNIYNYGNFDQIADNPDIDIVYIVLPPAMHAEYVIKAAKAGKHVWCEKPMAMTVAECELMISACRENNVQLSIGYRMQHEPNTRDIMAFVKEKPYGAIQKITAEAGYYDGRANHWKQNRAMGGGATYDMGVYCINAARYASGKEPIAVKASKSTTRPRIYKETDETMNFDLFFDDGTVATCETSLGKSLNRLHVQCANGWYGLEPFQAYSGIQGKTSDGKLLNKSIPNEQARQMDDDALAILQNTPNLVPGEEGLKDIRVVEAIFRSVEMGGKVEIGGN